MAIHPTRYSGRGLFASVIQMFVLVHSAYAFIGLSAFGGGELEEDVNKVTDMYPRKPRAMSLDCSCGRKNHMPSDLSTGAASGHRKKFHEYPWQVLIFHSRDKELPQQNETVYDHCGGSIINDRMILTSGNCLWSHHFDPYNSTHLKSLLFSKQPSSVSQQYSNELKIVIVDVSKKVVRLEIEEISYLQEFAVGKTILRDLDWDLGVIRLKTPLNFSDSLSAGLRPICLPSSGKLLSLLPGQKAHVLVWSYNEGGEPIETAFHLPTLALNSTFIHSYEKCRVNTWSKILSRRFLCMQATRISEPTHKGYPVMINTKDGMETFFQVGVTSWTSSHGTIRNRLPSDVFSSLEPFVGFIETKANLWEAKWCKREPTQELLPISEEFNPDILTIPGKDPLHPWKGFPSSSRNELIACRCGVKNTKEKAPLPILLPTNSPNASDNIPLSYGWNVKIVINREDTETYCGGSIINDRIIISAANCFYSSKTQERDKEEQIGVYLYCEERFRSVDESCWKRRKVHALIRYPDYNDGDDKNDIALLILELSLNFQSLRNKVTPVCLSKSWGKMNLIGRDDAIVARWVEEPSPKSKEFILQTMHVTILTEAQCQVKLDELKELIQEQGREDETFPTVTSAFGLCVLPDLKDFDHYRDTSRGGPLVITRFPVTSESSALHHQQFFQMGILTLGVIWEGGIGQIKVLEGYTNVQEYLSFIDYYSLYHGAKWCST